MDNKFKQKTFVLKAIEPIKKASAIDTSVIKKVISKLKKEDLDYEFVARVLIGEVDISDQRKASALLYIAEKLAPSSFLTLITDELNSKKVTDERKIFFLNMLANIGIMNHDDIDLYLSDPVNAISHETKKFMEKAMVDPMVRIDFLDFYFNSKADDKREILDTMLEDFEGDNLACLLAPIALCETDKKTVLFCLSELSKANSQFSIKPFHYLSHSKDEEISKTASRFFQKYSMKGLLTKEKTFEFNKKFGLNFCETKFYITNVDGNSNFIIAAERKTKDDAYYILFTALNTIDGLFSCFGRSLITKKDRDAYFKKFFFEDDLVEIPPEEGIKILDEFIIKAIENEQELPYEFFCWAKIIEDINASDKTLDYIFTKEPMKLVIPVNNPLFYEIVHYTETWFYDCEKNHPSCDMLNKVFSLKEDEFSEMKSIINTYSDNPIIKEDIKSRFPILIYWLKRQGEFEFANAYNIIANNEKKLQKFIAFILITTIKFHIFRNMENYSAQKNQKEYERYDCILDYINNNLLKGRY